MTMNEASPSFLRRDARVLLVDADAKTRVATHHLLRALGCRRIEEASTSSELLDVVTSTHLELLISTWGLGGLGGADLVWLVRHLPGLERLPVIICDEVTPAVIREAAEVGVNGFLPRPLAHAPVEELLHLFIGARSRASSESSNLYVGGNHAS